MDIRLANLKITTWAGISTGATHCYGKIHYGRAAVEVQRCLTSQQASDLNDKDGYDSDGLEEGDFTTRFDSEVDLIRIAKLLFTSFIAPQGFDFLVLGDPYVYQINKILCPINKVTERANAVYSQFLGVNLTIKQRKKLYKAWQALLKVRG